MRIPKRDWCAANKQMKNIKRNKRVDFSTRTTLALPVFLFCFSLLFRSFPHRNGKHMKRKCEWDAVCVHGTKYLRQYGNMEKDHRSLLAQSHWYVKRHQYVIHKGRNSQLVSSDGTRGTSAPAYQICRLKSRLLLYIDSVSIVMACHIYKYIHTHTRTHMPNKHKAPKKVQFEMNISVRQRIEIHLFKDHTHTHNTEYDNDNEQQTHKMYIWYLLWWIGCVLRHGIA